MTTTAHCAIAPPVATLFTCVVPANPSVVPAKAGTSHPCPIPNHPTPPDAPYGKRHQRDNYQLQVCQRASTMIPMLQQRPGSVPPACVTHLHTPPRFLQAWRGLLLPGPIPGVAKVHHRSLSPSQRLSPGGGATDPGSCLSPRRSREGGQVPSPLRGEG